MCKKLGVFLLVIAIMLSIMPISLFAADTPADTSLSSIKVNGKSLSGFSKNVYTYTLLAPEGMTELPIVEATSTSTDSGVKVTIEQATAIPGNATITVSYSDSKTVYTVNFIKYWSSNDEFDSTTLNSSVWHWVNEDPTTWSLTTTPGSMVISPRTGDTYGTSNDATNLLLQNVTGDWTIETKAVYSYWPNASYQQGGLMVYVDMDNYIKFEWEAQSETRTIIQDCRETAGETSAESVDGSIVPANNTIWYRIVKSGNTYTSYYSIDGTNFTQLRTGTMNFTNPQVGIYANNGAGTTTDLYIGFDYFHCNASGALIPEPSQDSKPYTITTADGKLVRNGGILATINVAPTQGATDHSGNEVILFEFMKGTTPVSIVALEKDITSPEEFTAYFNVDPTDSTYTVRAYVFDKYSNDMTAPESLAEYVILK